MNTDARIPGSRKVMSNVLRHPTGLADELVEARNGVVGLLLVARRYDPALTKMRDVLARPVLPV